MTKEELNKTIKEYQEKMTKFIDSCTNYSKTQLISLLEREMNLNTQLRQENERLSNIICDLEYELETEIKIGKETFPDDEFSNIVCETLKQVLNSLKDLKEGKE